MYALHNFYGMGLARPRLLGSVLDRILGAGGLDYAFYDFTQTDRMFQESVGPTPADDIGEAVGLWLDRHGQGNKTLAQVVAGQPDLLEGDGAGDSLDGWTAPVGSGSLVAGRFRVTTTAASAGRLVHEVPCTPGRLYAVTSDRFNGTAGPSIVVSNQAVNYGGVNVLQVTGAASDTVFFVAAQATQYLMLVCNSSTTDLYAEFDNISVKEVPSHYALQATGNARGIRQADGIKYDGSDDNHLTDWLAQAGANCIITKVTVPAIVGATQIIAGSGGASSMHCGVNTSGQIVGGMGSVTSSTIKGSIDRRGASVIVAIASDGASITRLFDGDAGMVYEAAFAGTMPPSTALRIGALNNGGSAANWFGGSIDKIAFGKVALTLSQFQQITAEWAD